MAASMKMAVFWVLAPCNLAEVYWHFRGTCCLPDDGGTKDLWNGGKLLPDHTALQPRRCHILILMHSGDCHYMLVFWDWWQCWHPLEYKSCAPRPDHVGVPAIDVLTLLTLLSFLVSFISLSTGSLMEMTHTLSWLMVWFHFLNTDSFCFLD
jgi:hypothetical protein